MFNEFNNEINELKRDYMAGQDEQVDDVIENASLVYNIQLKFFDDYILKGCVCYIFACLFCMSKREHL